MKFKLTLLLALTFAAPPGSAERDAQSTGILPTAPGQGFRSPSTGASVMSLFPDLPEGPPVDGSDCIPAEIRNALAAHTNILGCFEQRPAEYQTLPDQDRIAVDNRVCGCLQDPRRAPDPVIQLMRVPPERLAPLREGSDIAEHNFQRLRRRLENMRNGLVFQAQVISPNPQYHGFFRNSPLDTARQEIFRSNEGQLQNLITQTALGRRTATSAPAAGRLVSRFAEQLGPSTHEPSIPAPRPNQCVMPAEFVSYRQMPRDRHVFAELARGNFDHREWDHRRLREEYDELMARPVEKRMRSRDRIEKLKGKLRFLARNPHIRNILAADVEHVDELLTATGTTPEVRNQTLAVFRDTEKLGQMKLQLFNTLRSLTEGCADPSSCFRGERLARYNRQLREFFMNPDAGLVAKVENDKEMFLQLNNFATRATTRQESNELTHRGLLAGFVRETGLRDPASCSAGVPNAVECLQVYSVYCRHLSARLPLLRANFITDPVLVNDLDADEPNEFNLDINTNVEFQRFNEEVCNTPRRRSASLTERPLTFNQYREERCRNSSDKICRQGPHMISLLREQFLREFPHQALVRTGAVPVDTETLSQINRDNYHALGDPAQSAKSGSSAGSVGSGYRIDQKAWGRMAEASAAQGPTGSISGDPIVKPEITGPGAAATRIPDTGSGAVAPLASDGVLPGLSNLLPPPVTTAGVPHPTDPARIEDMSPDRRRELLQDWQREYDDFRSQNQNSTDPQVSAREQQMSSEIASLRALVAQQQELTREQGRLLNEAIANRRRSTAATPAAPGEEGAEDPVRRSAPAVVARAAEPLPEPEPEVARAPASVRDPQVRAAAVTPSSGPRRTRAVVSGDASPDSVAREEAKLVNFRRNTDGTITVESAGASGAAAGNAITVPVSDEQYRMLQANPQGLNLGQLERNIPREHLDRLGRQGEIVILLRNGANPPFEVLVERRDNRLVYRVRDPSGRAEAPVRRVHTLQSLELELQTRR
jgi:hypothetical protein